MSDIERRFNNIQEVEPDMIDLAAIRRTEKADDTDEGISLEQMDALRKEQKYSGKISLRVPKTLHK